MDIILITRDPDFFPAIQDALDGEFSVQKIAPFDRLPSTPVALVDMNSVMPQEAANLAAAEDAAFIALVPQAMLETFGGFEGMEDWVVQGASPAELRSRVRMAMRRQGLLEQLHAILLEDLVIDQDRYEVRVKGIPVELTYKEFELLRFLASNPGRVFSREVLLDRVWGYDYYGGTRTVDVHIRRIRSKIETGAREYIKTVRGAGYMFE